jgi:hypothetical protein
MGTTREAGANIHAMAEWRVRQADAIRQWASKESAAAARQMAELNRSDEQKEDT